MGEGEGTEDPSSISLAYPSMGDGVKGVLRPLLFGFPLERDRGTWDFRVVPFG